MLSSVATAAYCSSSSPAESADSLSFDGRSNVNSYSADIHPKARESAIAPTPLSNGTKAGEGQGRPGTGEGWPLRDGQLEDQGSLAAPLCTRASAIHRSDEFILDVVDGASFAAAATTLVDGAPPTTRRWDVSTSAPHGPPSHRPARAVCVSSNLVDRPSCVHPRFDFGWCRVRVSWTTWTGTPCGGQRRGGKEQDKEEREASAPRVPAPLTRAVVENKIDHSEDTREGAAHSPAVSARAGQASDDRKELGEGATTVRHVD